MSHVKVKSDSLRTVYNLMNSAAMKADAVLFNIFDNKLTLMTFNDSETVILGYQSDVIESDDNFDVSMFLKDLKNILELSKGEDIDILKTDGKNICKIGKVKKTVPQPVGLIMADKKFKVKYPLKMTLKDDDIDAIVKSFGSDENSEVVISATGSVINISSKDDARKVEFEFNENEMEHTMVEEDVSSRYDASLFIPILKALPSGSVFVEVGTNKPVKISMDWDTVTIRVYIAPRIADD